MENKKKENSRWEFSFSKKCFGYVYVTEAGEEFYSWRRILHLLKTFVTILWRRFCCKYELVAAIISMSALGMLMYSLFYCISTGIIVLVLIVKNETLQIPSFGWYLFH